MASISHLMLFEMPLEHSSDISPGQMMALQQDPAVRLAQSLFQNTIFVNDNGVERPLVPVGVHVYTPFEERDYGINEDRYAKQYDERQDRKPGELFVPSFRGSVEVNVVADSEARSVVWIQAVIDGTREATLNTVLKGIFGKGKDVKTALDGVQLLNKHGVPIEDTGAPIRMARRSAEDLAQHETSLSASLDAARKSTVLIRRM
jgi:hypothetical protein